MVKNINRRLTADASSDSVIIQNMKTVTQIGHNMVSINEIAKLAKVSKATVSRTINNSGYVSAKTRKKIEKIIDEIDYVPSASAVNLSRGVTNGIGVVIPEIDNTFYGEVLRGIIDESNKGDIQLFFYDTQNDEQKEKETLRTIARQQLLGVIIAPSVDYTLNKETRELVDIIDKLAIPVVIVDREFEDIQWDGVFFENYQSGYQAATELIKAGNQRIGIITGGNKLKISRDRYKGFRQALEDNGITARECDILEGDFSTEMAYRLSREIFEAKDYPEAIVPCNNRSSIGFLKAAKECGIKIGRDIALVGIDNIPNLKEAGVPFSCISRDNQEMGAVALRLLLERIKCKEAKRKVCMISYKMELDGTEKRK